MRATCFAALAFILLAGCQSTDKVLAPVAYDYTAYNAKGDPVVTGTISLSQLGDKVSGDWTLVANEGVKFSDVGPQIGDGRLSGEAGNNVIVVNLQPGSFDNHIILQGRLENRLFSGWWQYVGFGGVVAEGSFAAVAR